MADNEVHASIHALKNGMKSWQHQVAGVELFGWCTELTGKPVIHFLHGNGFSALTYAPFLKELMTDFDLVLTQAQGHGGSSSNLPFRGWNENAGYVLDAWNTQFQLPKSVPSIAMGHSFGGVLSALMCAEKQNHFDQLVMLDPVLFLPSMIGLMAFTEFVGLGSVNKLAKITLKRQTTWSSRAEALASFKGKGMFKTWTDEALGCYVSDALEVESTGKVTLKCPPEIEAGIFGSYPKQLWPSVRKIKVPVSMFYGKNTYPFVHRAAIKLRKLHRDAYTQVLPGDHCFMLSDPIGAANEVKKVIQSRL